MEKCYWCNTEISTGDSIFARVSGWSMAEVHRSCNKARYRSKKMIFFWLLYIAFLAFIIAIAFYVPIQMPDDSTVGDEAFEVYIMVIIILAMFSAIDIIVLISLWISNMRDVKKGMYSSILRISHNGPRFSSSEKIKDIRWAIKVLGCEIDDPFLTVKEKMKNKLASANRYETEELWEALRIFKDYQ